MGDVLWLGSPLTVCWMLDHAGDAYLHVHPYFYMPCHMQAVLDSTN